MNQMNPSELSVDPPPFPLGRLISGGQTGVDQIALEVALAVGIPIGGWCPKGRLCESGVIPPRFILREAASELYQERTRLNVRDSDATLILTFGPPAGGTALTLEIARTLRQPFLVLDLAAPIPNGPAQTGRQWLWRQKPGILNVAGPRLSECVADVAVISTVLRSLVRRHEGEPPFWPPARPATPSLPGTEMS